MTTAPTEPPNATVLVVDDAAENLELMYALLKGHYKVKGANNSARALQIANGDDPPDLILLDIMMPDMDGYEVCAQLKQNPKTRDIPVIFLTAKSAMEDEERGFALGAVDYITKPVIPPIVLARVRTHLALKSTADFLVDKTNFLEKEVSKRTRELSVIQDVTIMAMASLAEARDSETGNHIRRVQHYIRALGWKLSTHPRFRSFLTVGSIAMLYKSAPLHDLGKVGIPDRILHKPGRLDPDEFNIMKRHTTLGRDAIEQAEQTLGADLEFLNLAKEIAYTHHEKWDGTGYPRGLAGDNIPVCGRLMALADVYDALISRRIYKEPVSHEQAMQAIVQTRGRHFDPDVVDAFVEINAQFHAIALTYADTDADLQRKVDFLKDFQAPPTSVD